MEIKKLSNEELLLKTKSLVAQERELLLEILLHLKEIDSRKLYLEIGYSSLWAYCTDVLQYSEASAQWRIEAMRALREMPVLAEKIESGALSLSNIARAQSVMRKADAKMDQTNKKKLELFLELENKSQKEAETILAGYFPKEVKKLETVRILNDEFSEIKLSFPTDVLEKLNRAKELFSHKNPNPTWVETLEMMADFVISKKDPAKGSPAIKATQLATEISAPPQRRLEKAGYIPAAIRRTVWQKGGGSCEYTDIKSGKRCDSRHQLEIEHLKPRAFGGNDENENLKLFCRAHNQHAARAATLI